MRCWKESIWRTRKDEHRGPLNNDATVSFYQVDSVPGGTYKGARGDRCQRLPRPCASIAELEAQLARLTAERDAPAARADKLQRPYDRLLGHYELLKRRIFIAQAERVPHEQLEFADTKKKLEAMAKALGHGAEAPPPEPREVACWSHARRVGDPALGRSRRAHHGRAAGPNSRHGVVRTWAPRDLACCRAERTPAISKGAAQHFLTCCHMGARRPCGTLTGDVLTRKERKVVVRKGEGSCLWASRRLLLGMVGLAVLVIAGCELEQLGTDSDGLQQREDGLAKGEEADDSADVGYVGQRRGLPDVVLRWESESEDEFVLTMPLVVENHAQGQLTISL